MVENSISHLRKWKICYLQFPNKIKELEKAMEEHDIIVETVAGLVNLYVMPIRTYGITES